jgi:hypothetical protein
MEWHKEPPKRGIYHVREYTIDVCSEFTIGWPMTHSLSLFVLAALGTTLIVLSIVTRNPAHDLDLDLPHNASLITPWPRTGLLHHHSHHHHHHHHHHASLLHLHSSEHNVRDVSVFDGIFFVMALLLAMASGLAHLSASSVLDGLLRTFKKQQPQQQQQQGSPLRRQIRLASRAEALTACLACAWLIASIALALVLGAAPNGANAHVAAEAERVVVLSVARKVARGIAVSVTLPALVAWLVHVLVANPDSNNNQFALR